MSGNQNQSSKIPNFDFMIFQWLYILVYLAKHIFMEGVRIVLASYPVG